MKTGINKGGKIVFIPILFSIFFWAAIAYLCTPRRIPFRLVASFSKPSIDYDYSYCLSFSYASDSCLLMHFLTKNHRNNDTIFPAYDSVFVRRLSDSFNYDKNDYIISYQKRIRKLSHSPLLSKTQDRLWFDKRIPLIPTWERTITDELYVYEIPKGNFRAPGP